MLGDLFGATIDGGDVEAALLAHLKLWMPTYLPDAVREKDPDKKLWPGGVGNPADTGKASVLPVREFTVKHAADDNWPAEQLPMLLAHAPGHGKATSREGDGRLTGHFLVNLSAIASGGGIDDTKLLARVYSNAAIKAIMQKPDLGGFAEEVEWLDSKNMRPPGAEKERSIMSVVNVLLITVPGILNLGAGPDEPLPDPETSPGERPVVKEGGASADVRPGQAAVDRLRQGGHFEPEDP